MSGVDEVTRQAKREGYLPHALARRSVDLVHLARYTLGNAAFEHEILRLFSRQSKLYLQRLEDAASDDAAWRSAAHTIKISAASVGAWRVAETAAAAETIECSASAEERRALVTLLKRQIAATDRFIHALLADA